MKSIGRYQVLKCRNVLFCFKAAPASQYFLETFLLPGMNIDIFSLHTFTAVLFVDKRYTRGFVTHRNMLTYFLEVRTHLLCYRTADFTIQINAWRVLFSGGALTFCRIELQRENSKTFLQSGSYVNVILRWNVLLNFSVQQKHYKNFQT